MDACEENLRKDRELKKLYVIRWPTLVELYVDNYYDNSKYNTNLKSKVPKMLIKRTSEKYVRCHLFSICSF